MPGYLQIQTCIPFKTESEFSDAKRVAERVFVHIGMHHEHIQVWLSKFTWNDLLDFGFVDTTDWNTIIINDTQIQIAPNICGFPKNTDLFIDSHWIEINVLLKSEDVSVSLQDWRYRRDMVMPLWHLVNSIASVNNAFGTFLTDEAGNAKPWYALMGVGEGLWAFDLALIPPHLAARFSEIPQTHSAYDGAHGLGLARRAAWLVLPWSADQP